MRLTDWLGNDFGVGDRVIYPVGAGRSIELQRAIVLDIWIVYMCPDDYKWKRLEEGAEVPTEENWEWDRSVTPPAKVSLGREPVRTERRVRLQPLGKGSRNFWTREDSKAVYVDPDGNDVTRDEMVKRLEAEHGPEYTRHGEWSWQPNWDYRDFGYTRREESIAPRPVTLTQGIDNITLIERKVEYRCEDCGSTQPYLHAFHPKTDS